MRPAWMKNVVPSRARIGAGTTGSRDETWRKNACSHATPSGHRRWMCQADDELAMTRVDAIQRLPLATFEQPRFADLADVVAGFDFSE